MEDWFYERLKKVIKTPFKKENVMNKEVYNWMKEWVDRTSQTKYENSFNENSDEWTEIEGIGKFKGLEIVTENNEDIHNITITLKYDKWDKQ